MPPLIEGDDAVRLGQLRDDFTPTLVDALAEAVDHSPRARPIPSPDIRFRTPFVRIVSAGAGCASDPQANAANATRAS